MSKGLLIAFAMAVACAGFSTGAAATSKWEKNLLARYVNHQPCTGKGAPAWGKAAMARWRAAQRHTRHYDAY